MDTTSGNQSVDGAWVPPDNSTKFRFMKVPSLGPLEAVDCPLCGPLETSLVCVQGWFGDDFRVVRCPRCTLMFTNPRPTPEWKSRYYDPAFNAYIEAQGRDFLYAQKDSRVPGYHHLLRFLASRVRPGASLLDGGCAMGVFVKLACDAGFSAKGCDYSERAVAYGREHFGVDIVPSPIEDVAVPDESFEVVTLLHVFEHLADPNRALAEVRRILKPGGLFLLETVNYLPHYYIERYARILIPLYCRLTGRPGLPWFPFDHLFHWTPSALCTALQQAGFRDVDNHFLPGYRSEGIPSAMFGAIYNACGFVGGGLRCATSGRADFWPVLLATARK